MLDTAGKITKKDYNKIGTEDDPIIIAQRFLNIFRQLHIFTAERKEAFNRMILEQTPEVRGMFGSLPGGAVLQQYVDDLEEKSGIIRSFSGAIPGAEKNPPQAQILAAAMAEANGGTQALSGQDKAEASRLAAQAAAEAAAQAAAAAQAQIAAQTAQLQQAMAQMQKAAPATSGTSTITTDASFAKEIASALKEAVTISDDNRRKDSEEMTKTLLDSQKKLAEIMLMSSQIQQQSQASANSNAADDRTSQTRTVFQPISSTLTADDSFAKEIASALKEAIAATDDNRKKESQELTRAIVDSQNKLAEIMVQNNSATLEAQNRLAQMLVQNNTANSATSSNNNANNIQINTAATFPPVEEMVSGIVKVQSELFKEMAKTQTSELSAIITLALKESQQLSTQSIITAIREMQKENLKFLQMHPVNYAAPTPASAPTPPPASSAMPDFSAPPAETPETTVLSTDDDTDEILTQFGEEAPQKKKKKKKKKKKNSDGISLDGIASSLLDKVSTLTDKVSSLSGKKIFQEKGGEENFLPEDLTSDIFAAKTGHIDAASTDEAFAEIGEAALLPEGDAGELLSEEAAADDDSAWIYSEAPAEGDAGELMSEEAAADDNGAWVYSEAPVEGDASELMSEEAAADDNSAWVYSEAPAEGDAGELLSEEAATEEDWEWEYEENEDETPSMSALADNSAAEPEEMSASASHEEEWEWDYEEVSEEEDVLSAAETPQAFTETGNEEDGWEYVELPEDEADENAEGDWEYVEVPEDEAEGEWDYTEAAEDDTAATPMAAEGSEEEWEWDYEEVSEEDTPANGEANLSAPADNGEFISQPQGISLVNEGDPYRPDNKLQQTGDSENASLSSMYSGEVYFQDNVYKQQDADTLPFDLPDNLADSTGFSEFEDKDDANEPYKPQETI